MSRRRPFWLPVLAAMLATAGFVALGVWQLHRAAEKRALIDMIRQGTAAPTQPLPDSPAGLARLAYHRARAHGHFLPGHQFLLDNKILHGRLGFDVLTPFVLEDGRTVLVDRGWTPAGPDRKPIRSITLDATGPMEIAGRIWLPEAGVAVVPALAAEQAGQWPRLTTRIDYPALSGALGRPLVHAVLRADGGASWVLAPRPLRPTFGPARHYGYAAQWFALALTVIIVTVALLYRRRRRSEA
ncbi:MAG TPA: SURF1 family protein [Gammaproteobacteria bacterium]|nr:SURF1 family protein [Gammaproteobacteria bacterium]